MAAKLRILHLEDNPSDRLLVRRQLEKDFPDLDLAGAIDADEFGHALGRDDWDLVITDFQLKWTDGLSVLKTVKARHPDMPVIMFTHTATQEEAVEAMKAGLDDYVVKSPKHFVRLAPAIRWALERAETRRQRNRLEQEREALLARERQARLDAEAAREEAERANRAKDEFLATVSHELRTPLNAILGWASMLATQPMTPEDLGHGHRTILRSARALTQLVDDLLDLSRIVTGRLQIEPQAVWPVPLVEEAVETVRPAAEAKGLRIRARLDPAAGPVRGDPDRLRQVFWNILSNAVKFSNDGGRIDLTLEVAGPQVRFTAADDGVGIAPDFLPFVFDRFRQADGSTTRRHGGLGLGLSIVKHLVELHGGTVRAASEGSGKGAVFTVELPLMSRQ